MIKDNLKKKKYRSVRNAFTPAWLSMVAETFDIQYCSVWSEKERNCPFILFKWLFKIKLFDRDHSFSHNTLETFFKITVH